MGVRIRHLGHDCMEIVLPSGKVLVTNPFIEMNPHAAVRLEDLTGADYITISEDDFVACADVVPLVNKFNSKVICTPEMGRILHGRPFVHGLFNLDYANIVEVMPGNTVAFDDLKVEAKQAEHISLLQSFRIKYRIEFGREPHKNMTIAEMRKVLPRLEIAKPEADVVEDSFKEAGVVHAGQQLNFVFQAMDNLRIYYYFGGTFEFMRHELIEARPNILIMQMYGNEPEKVAEFAAASGAELIIPLGASWPKGDMRLVEVVAQRLAELSKAHFAADMILGKWYEIGVGPLGYSGSGAL